jgi:Tol biopolymer transport system component
MNRTCYFYPRSRKTGLPQMKRRYLALAVTLVLLMTAFAASQLLPRENTEVLPTRMSRIPADAVKMTPLTDAAPPKSLTDDYADPVPVPGLVNTAGAEDSAFVMPNGNTLYFFFCPDVRVPVDQQVQDKTVGIYVSHLVNGSWSEPQRVILQDSDKLAMDGAEFVQDNVMFFASTREGYTGIHWFRAEYVDGKWQNWSNEDEELKTSEYQTRELHISPDGNELYFHSTRNGGKGGLDIWISRKENGEWAEPLNVAAVNSQGDEGWPALSPDGSELWFSRDYAVWRSVKLDGAWQTPIKMFSTLCGEPSVDSSGNVYFTHHFFANNTMIEADIYVAYKK